MFINIFQRLRMAPRLSDRRWAHSKRLENVKRKLERAAEEATRHPREPLNDHRCDCRIKMLRATAST